MKKVILVISVLSICACGYAQQPVQIKGRLNKEYNNKVRLFKVVDGEMNVIATADPQLGNKFGFTFYPEYEGFYAIGTGEQVTQADNLVFYFKPGDVLDVSIDDEGFVLEGKGNSKENMIMAKWNKESRTIENKAFNWEHVKSSYVDFFPLLERVEALAQPFINTNKSGNKKFDGMFSSYVKWNIAAAASTLLLTPRSAQPSLEEYPDYYKKFIISDFSKHAAIVYDMPWGKRTLNFIYNVSGMQTKDPYKGTIEDLQKKVNRYSNDTLKADAVLEYLAHQRRYDRFLEASEKFNGLMITDRQHQQFAGLRNDMAQLKPGDQGLDFSFPDKDGKNIKFSDLKGKVVLIDVWATWCGPCKEEIPYLKKLEKEIAGTDVQIVSISVDQSKDRDKWLKMIKEEQLGGMQLFASGWGDFAQYYKIEGIPRFMVFDRSGKIVTVNSPRPSDPQLKKLLEKVLSEK